MSQSLIETYDATPFFTHHPYDDISDDPLCDWLLNFESVANITRDDFGRINGLSADDIVFYDTALPAQLFAIINWAQSSFTVDTCPTIIIGYCEYPGVISAESNSNKQWELINTPSILYRFASKHLKPEFETKIHFTSLDINPGKAYEFLLQREVLISPNLIGQLKRDRPLPINNTLTMGFIGAQRPHHGFQYVPEIVRQVIKSNDSVRIIIQDSSGIMQSEINELKLIQSECPRVQLIIENMGSSQAWDDLHDECDFLVLPYDRISYSVTISGICAGAISRGIPHIAPSDTGLSAMLNKYNNPGIIYNSRAPQLIEEIVNSIHDMIRNYDHYQTLAAQSRILWSEQNGAEKFCDFIFNIHGAPQNSDPV